MHFRIFKMIAHQWLSGSSRVHQKKFRPIWFKGPTSKDRGEEGEWDGKERKKEGKRMGKEGKGKGKKIKTPPSIP